jgi:hypothetical protein
MLRKPDQNFGAWPLISKRLPCEFAAMQGRRPEPVKIHRLDLPLFAGSSGGNTSRRSALVPGRSSVLPLQTSRLLLVRCARGRAHSGGGSYCSEPSKSGRGQTNPSGARFKFPSPRPSPKGRGRVNHKASTNRGDKPSVHRRYKALANRGDEASVNSGARSFSRVGRYFPLSLWERAGARGIRTQENSRKHRSSSNTGDLQFLLRSALPVLGRSARGRAHGAVSIDFSSLTRGKRLIRSCWSEDMRGACSEIMTRTQVRQIPCGRKKSMARTGFPQGLRIVRFIRVSTPMNCESFLFYLTGRTIFDNRHGLRKKFDGGRVAKTLSVTKPQK